MKKTNNSSSSSTISQKLQQGLESKVQNQYKYSKGYLIHQPIQGSDDAILIMLIAILAHIEFHNDKNNYTLKRTNSGPITLMHNNVAVLGEDVDQSGKRYLFTRNENGEAIFFNTLIAKAKENMAVSGYMYALDKIPQIFNLSQGAKQICQNKTAHIEVLQAFKRIYFIEPEYACNFFKHLTTHCETKLNDYKDHMKKQSMPNNFSLDGKSSLAISMKLLEDNKGLVIGNNHMDHTTVTHLSSALEVYNAKGVMQLFVEFPAHTESIFANFNNPNNQAYGNIEILNNNITQLGVTISDNYAKLYQLLVAANKNGIQVWPASLNISESRIGLSNLVKPLDNHMAYTILRHTIDVEDKFIFYVGLAHSGVALKLNVPMIVYADDSNVNLYHFSGQVPYGINQSCSLLDGTQFCADVVMKPPSLVDISHARKVGQLYNAISYIAELLNGDSCLVCNAFCISSSNRPDIYNVQSILESAMQLQTPTQAKDMYKH